MVVKTGERIAGGSFPECFVGRYQFLLQQYDARSGVQANLQLSELKRFRNVIIGSGLHAGNKSFVLIQCAKEPIT